MIEITAEYLSSQGLSQNFPQRFWRKVIKTNACWFWSGGKNEHGYGILWSGHYKNGFLKAHRAAWILCVGKIPKGKFVLHHCDNPPCVRPDHLFLGNNKENGLDASSKGRIKRGDRHWNTKISDADVLELRSLYKKHAKNQKVLAARFGISVFTLRSICYGRHRKHLIKLERE